MSVTLKDVEFSSGTGIVGSTVSVTGVAAPTGGWKAVLLATVGRSEAIDAGGAGQPRRIMGWAAATTEGGGIKQNAVGTSCEHNVSADTADSGEQIRSDCCLAMVTFTGADAGRASLTSFNSDGFTLTIDQQFSVDTRVIALLIGGGDITNIEIGGLTMPTTGTEPFTTDQATGFTCQDNEAVAFFLGGIPNNEADNVADSHLGFGCATAPGNNFAWAGAANDVNPTTTLSLRTLTSLSCYAQYNAALTVINKRCRFNSWITNGFRLQWDSITGTACRLYWMVIKGGKWKVATGSTATSLSAIAVSGVGFAPVGGLVVSHHGAENGATTGQYHNTDQHSIGFFTGPASRRSVAYYSRHGVGTSAIGTRIEHDEVYCQTDQTGAVVGLMDVQSMDADGVTFVMDDADPSAGFFAVLLAGSSGGAGGTGGGMMRRLRRRG